MGELITISARISRELKQKADDLGVNISEVVRKALEEEVRRRKHKRVMAALWREMERGPRLPDGTIVKIIRSMREGRRVGVNTR
jgi:post-segregation antitoxin (ccd killing protein)